MGDIFIVLLAKTHCNPTYVFSCKVSTPFVDEGLNQVVVTCRFGAVKQPSSGGDARLVLPANATYLACRSWFRWVPPVAQTNLARKSQGSEEKGPVPFSRENL